MEKQTINESKLVQLISYLRDKEFKELGLWVRSPIHNTNQNVIDLCDVLKKYRKAVKPISILAVMKQLDILPRTAREKDVCMRSKQELRRTMHLLTEQIEHFLVWKKTQTDTITCKRRLMEELYAREAYQLIPAIMKKARKIHETSPLRDVQYCKDEYQLAEMDLYMTTILKNRNMAGNIEQTVDALRQYSVSQLLRYYKIK